ncbi:cocaine esterase-like [Phymastichus coffea]|uniref:cocaine esterase-like n=1 Tax=Phymastichus coffea TaxID=108790 RepID=UPI00273B25AA|nr:cocaine esterase-like [Phymastichus coffea]
MDVRIFSVLALLTVTNLDYVQCIVGGKVAPAPPVDDPVVYSRKFDRDARVFGTRDKTSGYYLFRGIRYAEPPIGQRRFRRPIPIFLEGDVNATRWEAPCLQPTEDGQIVGSEDCLYLNVFTPNLPDSGDGYPVIIWIHGGGFRRGAASQYEMRDLIKQRVILVSIQYRLGSLGFLSNEDENLSGNNGLFDMALATDWVRQYIEFFGGNPNQIVAMGQGTGASSAFLLGLSQYGQSYFSGIIAMSGSLLSRFAVEREPRRTTQVIAAGNNCPFNETVEMVRCLRELPASRIIEQDSKFESTEERNFITDLSSLLGTGPVVEGKDDQRSLPKFVQDEPEDSLNSNEVPKIPLLIGVVKDETGGAVYGPFKNTISQQLKEIPDFLTKYLVPNLQKIVPVIGNIQKQFIPEAFAKYLDPFGITGGNGNKRGDSIAKVSEALNDAIFNAPAFLTVKSWAKKSKAYLYSFDHDSKHGFGKDFLSGLPIVGRSADNGKTSHGDELGYLFNPNNIHGKPMKPRSNFNEEDQRVKDIFTTMIAEFARTGNVSGGSNSKDGFLLPFSLPSFSDGNDENDDFLSITSKPTVNKQFRFCQMGLWTGIEERFTSPLCSLFHVDLKNPLKTFEKAVKSVPSLGQFAKVGSVSDFLNTSAIPQIPFVPSLNDIPFKPPISLPGINSGKAPIPKIPIPGLLGQKPSGGNSNTGKPAIPGIGFIPTVTNPTGFAGIFG